ncbi:MAG: hypothetical protein BRD33_03905 [Bacteroidetes bacterium QH_6_63_17]|nr:MAG: hypothetical protein BRD33_03905 [Bacteroidetes bacterium QH_6_63_17]
MEDFSVVNVGVLVESIPGLRIGGVDEESDLWISQIRLHGLHPVTANELNPVGRICDLGNAVNERVRVPSRVEALSIFPFLYPAGSGSGYSSSAHPIMDNHREGSVPNGMIASLNCLLCRLPGHVEVLDLSDQPLGIPIDNRFPNGGDVLIDLNEDDLLGELFDSSGKSSVGSPSKRLDKYVWSFANNPSLYELVPARFSARITEGTILRNSRNVGQLVMTLSEQCGWHNRRLDVVSEQ